MSYAVQTARVIFMGKTSFDVPSLDENMFGLF